MSFFSISESTSYSTSNAMSYFHSHDYFEIYLQLSGTRTYFRNNQQYTLEENTLVVSKPNVLHMFNGASCHRYLVSVDEAFFSQNQIEFLNDLDKKTLISIDRAHIPEIIDTLDKLKKIEQSVADDKNVLITLHLGFLLYQIHVYQTEVIKPSFSLRPDAVNNFVSPTILKIMEYIQKHYQEKISLNDLSQEFNLSKTWLCKCFFKATGVTVWDYKIMLQIEETKHLLKSTSISIANIAQKTGFSSSRHLSLTFKKHTGITPLRWRRNFRAGTTTSLKKYKNK